MTKKPPASRPGRRTPYDGDEIRRRRQEAGLTQIRLAELSGVSQGHITRLENGEIGASAPTLLKLATALGCKIPDLMPAETEARPA